MFSSVQEIRLERATVLEDFFEAPVGRYLAGPTYLYFCAHPELFGIVLWGRPSSEDMRTLTEGLVVELREHVVPHRSLVDASRVESAEAGAFFVLNQYVRKYHTELRRAVTRLAL